MDPMPSYKPAPLWAKQCRERAGRALEATAPTRMHLVVRRLPWVLNDPTAVDVLLRKPCCMADWRELAVQLARRVSELSERGDLR
jgi:hypothetical protein